MKKITTSFATGAIALVFAVLGYQTALLIHHAATAKIIADRDHPDTVFVCKEDFDRLETEYVGDGGGYVGENDYTDRACSGSGGYPGGESCSRAGSGRGGSSHQGSSGPAGSERGSSDVYAGNSSGSSHRYYRKNSGHSPGADAIRGSAPARQTENFRFNPNTVSVEDLVRLGFSPKQAQSIENYRAKGGRFRRKEDFAKSYVVSESIYERLEPYIIIPKLDINKADSAAFDSLPGIGGWYARKMLEYRDRLGGYSFKEQLMDIRGFDQEKFDGLCDLIYVSRPKAFRLWELSADSLKLHPYINTVQKARSIVFYREHNEKSQWTVEGLKNAGILTEPEANRLALCNIATVSE